MQSKSEGEREEGPTRNSFLDSENEARSDWGELERFACQTLTYSLQYAPAGAVINPETGGFTWAPGVGQGPQDYTLKVCVSDGTISNYQDVTIGVAGMPTQPFIKLYLPLISR